MTAFEEAADARVGVLYAHGANFTAGLELDRVCAIMRERGTLFPVGTIDPLSLRPPLRSKPLEVREQYERQLKELQEAYGEAMLELRARKKMQSLLGEDEK